LWFAHPTWTWIVTGSFFVVAGLAIRGAAAGHIRKNRELTTTGPYAYARNPLYLGSILIAIGFVVAARNPWIALAALVMFLVIYLPVIRAEEKYLRSAFAGYDKYMEHVPRLLPRLTPYKTGTEKDRAGYSPELYWRHREYNATLGAVLMMGALIAKVLLVRH
jgi:protein-S-isoprenylcysteine O-methyltransferase Ste14